MPAFIFVGDPSGKENPNSVAMASAHGDIVFPLNIPVEVKDMKLAAKLVGNKHFECKDKTVVALDVPSSKPNAAPVAAAKAEVEVEDDDVHTATGGHARTTESARSRGRRNSK